VRVEHTLACNGLLKLLLPWHWLVWPREEMLDGFGDDVLWSDVW
jgi:hypothetical protein